jgi:hypothetical protein
MTVSTTPEGLPLDDRSDALKIPIVVLIVFSSIFVALRLGISWRNRNYFLLTDHLLWTGHVSARQTRDNWDCTDKRLGHSCSGCRMLLQTDRLWWGKTCLGSYTDTREPGELPVLHVGWSTPQPLRYGAGKTERLRLHHHVGFLENLQDYHLGLCFPPHLDQLHFSNRHSFR